jgi:hypothetical protein
VLETHGVCLTPYRANAEAQAENQPVVVIADANVNAAASLYRQFSAQYVLGSLLALLLYPPALVLFYLVSLDPFRWDRLLGVSASTALMVSGVFMLVYAYRIANAFGRNEFPLLPSGYIPYSIAHYLVSAIPCFWIAWSEYDWPVLSCCQGCSACMRSSAATS